MILSYTSIFIVTGHSKLSQIGCLIQITKKMCCQVIKQAIASSLITSPSLLHDIDAQLSNIALAYKALGQNIHPCGTTALQTDGSSRTSYFELNIYCLHIFIYKKIFSVIISLRDWHGYGQGRFPTPEEMGVKILCDS